MSGAPVTESERTRRADNVITAVTAKLERHRNLLGSSRHGSVTWRVDERGKVSVELKPTL